MVLLYMAGTMGSFVGVGRKRPTRATRAFLQVLFRQRWVGAQISTNPREPGAVPSPGTNDVLDRREFASDGFRNVLQRTAPISCEQ